MTAPRTFGVEEELLLLDAATLRTRAAASPVVGAAVDLASGDDRGPEVKHEFFLEQVEVASRPCANSDELRDQLRAGRDRVAKVGAPLGVVPAAIPLSLDEDLTATPTPGERYARIHAAYGQVARDSLFCALQVHVQVTGDDEAVGVIDRMRPWVPLLLAISANSPYWRGSDTGFASWRSQLWGRWPSSGPRRPFGDLAGYRASAAELIASGAALDGALLNFDVRASERYPTVELRVTDVCTDTEDAVAVAALTRALVTVTAEHWRRGRAIPAWSIDQLQDARDLAARSGLSDCLVHPVTGRRDTVAQAFEALSDFTGAALEQAGDRELVDAAVARWSALGDGATRQRAVHARGGLESVLADVVSRTVGRIEQRPR